MAARVSSVRIDRPEGGCQVDAKCDASCDVTVAAAATCATPAVTIMPTGASNAGAAATLKSALDAKLPAILALRAHLEVESMFAAAINGVATGISDLKPACIPAVISEASTSVLEISAGNEAAQTVAGSVQ